MNFNNVTPEIRAQAVTLMKVNGGTVWRNVRHNRLYFNHALLYNIRRGMALSERFRTFYLDMTTEGAWKFCNENGSECYEFGNQYFIELVELTNSHTLKII
jgi:hypothetical protein